MITYDNIPLDHNLAAKHQFNRTSEIEISVNKYVRKYFSRSHIALWHFIGITDDVKKEKIDVIPEIRFVVFMLIQVVAKNKSVARKPQDILLNVKEERALLTMSRSRGKENVRFYTLYTVPYTCVHLLLWTLI